MSGDRPGESTEEVDADLSEVSPERYDRQAEEFLNLEAALLTIDGVETVLSDATTTGVVIDAERISRPSVPSSYPVEIEAREALELTVSLGGDHQTTAYIEWPDRFTDEAPLVQLLASLDVHPSRFADLYGNEVPLEAIDSRYVLANQTPTVSTQNARSSRWVWGIAAGIGLWMVIWLLPEAVDVGGIALLAWMLLPVVTYFDLMYVRDVSEWTPSRWFWPVITAIWIRDRERV
ncbi:hypothetical protein [Halococcus salifodinae]|uniref:Uncharacterized protein n=1 Tax=Halococcus salifodinae DSM 8989 TaxID=1227456 RepID=M0N950_9EURY|nr:hypothetical protein [Halococcus salifodinae]EMA54482.1 hypothetical protein C450_05465 [Halococcus salifodinae DSM 8989]